MTTAVAIAMIITAAVMATYVAIGAALVGGGTWLGNAEGDAVDA
jgi:hypothetical protein